MNVKTAAQSTRALIPQEVAVRAQDGRGINHAAFLLDAVAAGQTKNEQQANRWLAWAQCLLNEKGITTLSALKAINLNSQSRVCRA